MSKNPDVPKTKLTQEQIQQTVQRNSGRDPNNPIIGSQAYADKKAAEEKGKGNQK